MPLDKRERQGRSGMSAITPPLSGQKTRKTILLVLRLIGRFAPERLMPQKLA